MKISLLCIGALGSAPEGVLARGWAERASKVGRARGLGPVEIVELEARRGGRAAEAEILLRRAGEGHLIACDEHGQALASRDFAASLGRLRDQGVERLVFALGGADGLDSSIIARARQVLAFGPQTWPHALARAMLTEQLYRAASLMAGQPYHRD